MKRDALAFVCIAAALLVALREWFRISGQDGDFIHHAAAGSVGLFSVVVPVALIAFSIELFRARNGEQALPHHVAGGIGLVNILPDEQAAVRFQDVHESLHEEASCFPKGR